MVTKTRSASHDRCVKEMEPIIDMLSERIARDIYYSIVLSKGIAEIKSGKGISGKKIDEFFESLLG